MPLVPLCTACSASSYRLYLLTPYTTNPLQHTSPTSPHKVPGFSPETAMAIVESELGKPIDELFDPGTFCKQPLAAASLGQVHRAKMGGKPVCVKVQRQGLKALFDMDLKNIKVPHH